MAMVNATNRNGDLVFAVLDAVSNEEGIEPEEIDTPLHNAIDPGAMNTLFEGRTDTIGSINFEYRGHCVTVCPDGSVEVS